MGERTIRLPAAGVRWTAVVAVLGEDALTTAPSWPGRVQFRLVGGNDGR